MKSKIKQLKAKLDSAKIAKDAAVKKYNNLLGEYDEAVLIPRMKALIGKCFHFRNSYSCPDGDADRWWLYMRVLGVKGMELECESFEPDRYGEFKYKVQTSRILPDEPGRGYTPISNKEWFEQLHRQISPMVLTASRNFDEA